MQTTTPTSEAPGLQITKAQHIFPRSCLQHFVSEGGKVQVHVLGTGRVEHLGPNSSRFTTTRGWDQRTEALVMQRIETDFGRAVTPIRKGRTLTLERHQHQVVSELFALWMLRAHRARNHIPDVQLNGVFDAGTSRTAASVNEMEANGIICVRPGGIVPGRQIAGVQLQLDLDRACNELRNVTWGVLRAAAGAGEFLVPDSPQRVLYIPLTPFIALAGGWEDNLVEHETVMSFNTAAIRYSAKFVAARDFTCCPFVSTPILQPGWHTATT